MIINWLKRLLAGRDWYKVEPCEWPGACGFRTVNRYQLRISKLDDLSRFQAQLLCNELNYARTPVLTEELTVLSGVSY